MGISLYWLSFFLMFQWSSECRAWGHFGGSREGRTSSLSEVHAVYYTVGLGIYAAWAYYIPCFQAGRVEGICLLPSFFLTRGLDRFFASVSELADVMGSIVASLVL